MVTVDYIWLQRVIHGYSGLHMVKWVTYGYIGLHMVTTGNIWLQLVTHGCSGLHIFTLG